MSDENLDAGGALDALGALSQATRLAAFRRLVQAGPDGLAAGAIAAALDCPPNTLSTHLAALHRAGLVTRERHGRSIRYRADYARMCALMTYLLEDCCQGNAEICAPLLEVVGQAC